MKNMKTFEGFIDNLKNQWKRDITGTLQEPIWIHINIFGNDVFMEQSFDNKPNFKLKSIISNKFGIEFHGSGTARFTLEKVEPIIDFLESIGLEKHSFDKKKGAKEIIFKGKLSLEDLNHLNESKTINEGGSVMVNMESEVGKMNSSVESLVNKDITFDVIVAPGTEHEEKFTIHGTGKKS